MAGLVQLIYLLGRQGDIRRREGEARERRWWAEERIIDPYREADRLPAFAASLFVQVQEARDVGDRDRLARLVSDDVLRRIELCGVVRAGWTIRVDVDGEPKVFYAGTGAGANRRDGAVFLIDAKLYEYEKDAEGRERPRGGGSTEVHEVLDAHNRAGRWSVEGDGYRA